MTVEEALADRLGWMSASSTAEAAIVVLSPYAPHYDELRDALNRLTGQSAGRFRGCSSGTSGHSPAKVPPPFLEIKGG
jgi:hypothetical protein